MSQLDLSPEQEKIVRQILAEHLPAGSQVWVFGSRVKGNAKRFSDLDLAIDIGRQLPLSLLAKLNHEFDESNLPFKVDVVDWLTISEEFRAHISSDRFSFNL